MNLTDLLAGEPLNYENAKQFALVFSAELADRLREVQREDAAAVAQPRQMSDGRFMLCADLLTEISSGGLYAEGFAKLNRERFVEIEVVPWADAVAMLPVNDAPQF